MKEQLGVVGDSFSCVNRAWNPFEQWPYLLGNALGMPVQALGRGGSDTVYIHTQMKYAVETLKVTHLVIWQTSSDRFIFPTVSNNKPLSANSVYNNCVDEVNYNYSDYDPIYVSDHASSIDKRFTTYNKQWLNAYNMFLLQLHDTGIYEYQTKIFCEHMYNYCDLHNIKTVIVDCYNREYDVKKSDNVTLIGGSYIKGYDPLTVGLEVDLGEDSEHSPNHMSLKAHASLANYLKGFY